MFIKMKELNARKADIESSHKKIYYLDDKLLAKRFLHLNQKEKKELQEKLEYAQGIKIKGVSIPIDKLETEKGFCGYIEEILPGSIDNKLINYTDYYNEHRYDIELSDITSYILECNGIVDECNENDIVNPDMCSEGNVLFNQNTRDVYYTDYQGMQVGNIKTNNISDFIAFDPILNEEKYIKDDLYSKNIDLYTLTIRCFYYMTKINVPRVMNARIFTIEELIKMANIDGTYFADCLRILHDKEKNNEDIKEALKELNEKYAMSQFISGEVRPLVLK